MPAQRPDTSSDERSARLKREVIPPFHQVPGTGLLFASAMLFALAGSVLALRTHATAHRARRNVAPLVQFAPAPLTPQVWPADPHLRATTPRCGIAQYQRNEDGSTTVIFEACVETADMPFR